MTTLPMFSVIVTDYEPSVDRDLFRRKMTCLAEQTCKDFEVLVYHDGPKQTPYAEETLGIALHADSRFIVTDARANDWGHTNRDRGIREARGEWIIHTNADNLFYPQLIERLKTSVEGTIPTMLEITRHHPRQIRSILKRIDRLFGTTYAKQRFKPTNRKEILIYGILMRGLLPAAKGYTRCPDLAARTALIFGGIPVRAGQIDAMQLVMRRDLWLQAGGWYDRREQGDGYMYEAFAKRYAVIAVPEVLGEHW
jgi:glycosyltransferase involved in cell wall biosynthesis